MMKRKTQLLPVRQRGIVLIIVLWVVALLAIMAGSFAYSMRVETLLATHGLERAQARALAEAGVAYAALTLLEARRSQTTDSYWPVDGSAREWSFGPGRVSIKVMDAAGRIDLNTGHRELWKGLLLSAGVENSRVEELLDALEDWRDPDDEKQLNGAERQDYLAAGRSWGPKNAPFESVEELRQVLGMTPAVYRRIKPAVTVFSGQAGIDPAAASDSVLRALPGIDPAVIDDYLALRAEQVTQGLPPPPLPVTGPYLSQSKRVAYHIHVAARLDNGSAFSSETVIKTGGDNQSRELPYRQLVWREGG